MRCHGYHARGFTLVEMMVIIGLMGLIAAIAVPSFNGYLRSNEVDTIADRITSDMALARSLSVAEGRIVRFASTTQGYQIIDPVADQVIRDRDFEGSVTLDAEYNIDFFPWGAADSATMNLCNGTTSRAVVVLPTGLSEVQTCGP